MQAITPTSAKSSAGTSQFDAAGGVALISSNTSPGPAKIFMSRAINDIGGGLGAVGCTSESEGGVSIGFWQQSHGQYCRKRVHLSSTLSEQEEWVDTRPCLVIRPCFLNAAFELLRFYFYRFNALPQIR